MRSVGTKQTNGFKKSWVTTFFATLVFVLLGGCRTTDLSDLGISLKIQEKKLPNGLRALLVEDHRVPVVSWQLWYRAGSIDEFPGITGVSHLFEHLMFKGTEKFGPQEYFIQLESKGAEVNAYTTRDHTVYLVNTVPARLPQVIEMEADRMQGLRLTPELLEVERRVVLEERHLRVENVPSARMQETLWAMAYRTHPYRYPVIGMPRDILTIDLDTIRSYYQAQYRPANALIVIVGDFSTEKTWAQIEAAFGPIEGGKPNARPLIEEPEQKEERRVVLRDKVQGERFLIGYPIGSARDDSTHAVDILSNILFEGEHARAVQALVEKQSLCLGISGTSHTPEGPGLLVVSAVMREGVSADRGEQALYGVLEELQEKGVSEAEVKRAVRQLSVHLLDQVRTPQGLAQLLGLVTWVLGSPDALSKDVAKYLDVTPTQVQEAAKIIFQPNRRNIVQLKPEATLGAAK